jgi:arabinosaccharide transport system substrate-binding protein
MSRTRSFFVSFPFGAAALCILCTALFTGAVLALNPPPQKRATLTFWVFHQPHYDSYVETIKEFEKAHPGTKVDMQVVALNAITRRLQAAFWSDLDVPDMVELESGTAGSFFRGPVKHIGFADLTQRIQQAGLQEKMVKARFTPYTNRGHIFGLPHDVHPVMIAYRRDIFEKEGVDVNKIKTWDDYIAVARKLVIPNKRYMLELNETDPSQLQLCLFQRGGGFFNAQGDCIFDNEIGVQTMLWYVPLVAGPKRIASNLGGAQILTRAVEDGYFLGLMAPDWRSKVIQNDIPRMKGKMALMPLPAVKTGGSHTSTWGGTMLGITKASKNQDLAWELAQALYLNKQDLAERFSETNILPALEAAWKDPAFSKPNPYYSNQPLGTLYAKLAPEVPARYSSPFIDTANTKLGEALVACVQRYNSQGDQGFEQFCRAQLKESADGVRAMMKRNPY